MNQTARKHPSRNHSTKRAADPSPSILPSKVLRAWLLTVAVGLASILLSALIAYFCTDPAPLLPALGLLSSALTAFLGGWIAGKLHGHAFLTVGLLNGVAMTVIMLPLSLLFVNDASNYAGWLSAVIHTAFLLFSALGGLAASKPVKKRKKRKK